MSHSRPKKNNEKVFIPTDFPSRKLYHPSLHLLEFVVKKKHGENIHENVWFNVIQILRDLA